MGSPRALAVLLLVVVMLAPATPSDAIVSNRRDRCDVRVVPGQDVVRAVADAGPGAHVCLGPGRYRITRPLRPHRGQVLSGSGAIIDGSRVLRPWRPRRTPRGPVWVIGGQRQEGEPTGTCLRGTACTRPDDVLLDGRPLRRVLALDRVAPGRYLFDYRRDRILLGSDPAGHRVEALVAGAGIVSRSGARGADVTVRGLTVEHTASRAQHGAIETSAPGWTVVGTTVRDNHGAGITTQDGGSVLRNRVLRNGQLGVGGSGPGPLVRGNLIVGNGRGGFDPAWEAGGAKWAVTDGLVVRDNLVLRNAGPGLWTDIDAQHTTYVGNVVRDNLGPGIFHEISADAVLRDNLVTGNGRGSTWLWGAGILVADSHDVEVTGNRLDDNGAGIGLIQQDRGRSEVDGRPRRLHRVDVHDNVVRLGRADTGLVQDDGNESVFDDPTLTWRGNTWLERGPAPFMWDDDYLTLTGWRALGHDVPQVAGRSARRRVGVTGPRTLGRDEDGP